MRSATADDRTVDWPAHLDWTLSDDCEPHPSDLWLTHEEPVDSVVDEYNCLNIIFTP